MGCTKSAPSQRSVRRTPPPPPFLNKFEEIFDLSHPLNINAKYTYILEIIPNRTTGYAIQTPAYNCLTTRNELLKKRKEFWETRTTGPQQQWNSIREAIECPSEAEARSIVSNAGLVLVKDSLQMSFDSKLMRYQIPIHCINDPITYSSEDLAHKNLSQSFEPKDIHIILRDTQQQDTPISTNTNTWIRDLKQTYLKGAPKKMRLFWKGRQLVDDSKLGHYQIQQNTIIQCLII